MKNWKSVYFDKPFQEKATFNTIQSQFFDDKILKITKTGFSLSKYQSVHWNVLRISIWEEFKRLATLIYMPQFFQTSEALLLILRPHIMISVNGKIMIYDESIKHFMARLIKKSWTDSNHGSRKSSGQKINK